MNTQDIIRLATQYIADLSDHTFDLLNIAKPISPDAAVNLAKVISKLSPLLGNLIEFNTVEFLNKKEIFSPFGEWERQDPGFPDTVFIGSIEPTPGLEIKTWFPLADRSKISAYSFLGVINLSKAATEQRLSASIQGRP